MTITPIVMSGWTSMPQGPGACVDLTELTGYYGGYSFQNSWSASQGQLYLSKMFFQTKHTYEPGVENHSLFVLGGLWTMNDAGPQMLDFSTAASPYGLLVPAGYVWNMPGNQLIQNAAAEESAGDHFIAMVFATLVD